MYGVSQNVVPFGSTTTTEQLIEDWVVEEAAAYFNLTPEAFDALPVEKQDVLLNEYLSIQQARETNQLVYGNA